MYVFQKDLTMLSGTVGVFFDLLFDLFNTKCHKGDVLKKEKKFFSFADALCNQ